MSFLSHGVTIENGGSQALNVTNFDGVTVININGASFSVADVPTVANQFSNTTTTETHSDLKAKLPLGELATREEVDAVIHAYYEKNAFESTSITVRGIIVGTKLSWAVWCNNPWLFGCLEWSGSGGTWVEFEVNGRNRSGGMTGYKRAIWMVRKFSQPQQPATANQ